VLNKIVEIVTNNNPKKDYGELQFLTLSLRVLAGSITNA
jgi:hypothetical protein